MIIKLKIPVLIPLHFEGTTDLHQKAVQDLIDASGLLDSYDESLLNVKYFFECHELIRPLLPSHAQYARELFLLVVKADITDALKLSIENDQIPRMRKKDHVKFIFYNIQHELSDIFLILNIIYPGSLSTLRGVAKVKKKLVGFFDGFYAEHLSYCLKEAIEKNWPSWSNCDLLKTWKWIKGSSIIEGGIGRGSLGRALAALSHTISDGIPRTESASIFWILLGLEALYCRGQHGLQQQIFTKAELLFGKKTEHKKDLVKLYDFRSRFIHGNVDFPLEYSILDGVKEYQEHTQSIVNYQRIGLTLLLATLQIMIKNSWEELKFDYVLTNQLIPDA